jgi:glycine cleavage system H protein
MANLKFTDEHEWIRIEGDVATVGITAYAAAAAGRRGVRRLPRSARCAKRGKDAAVVESVKAAQRGLRPASTAR